VDPLELLDRTEPPILVPEKRRAVISRDEAVEIAVVVDVHEAESICAAIVAGSPRIVEAEILRAVAKPLLSHV
jgi:hypothetical protein